jgi:short subunit dehydrogenase-like uncharacterized protein
MNRVQSTHAGVVGVYGATGYTGQLMVRALLARGQRLLLAARDQRALLALEATLERGHGELTTRAFTLDQRDALAQFAGSST